MMKTEERAIKKMKKEVVSMYIFFDAANLLAIVIVDLAIFADPYPARNYLKWLQSLFLNLLFYASFFY